MKIQTWTDCSFLSQHFVCQLHLLKCRLQNVPIQYLANAFSMHDKDHHHIMPLQCSMQWMRGSFSKAKISKNDISLRLINETKVEQHRSSNVIAPNQTVQIKNISLSVSAEWSCCIIVQISYVFVIMWYLVLVCVIQFQCHGDA